MKILFLCHHYPYPPDHGAKIRAYHFIRYLNQKHTVTVGTLAHTEQELVDGTGLKDSCDDVIAEVVPLRTRWFQALAALCSRSPSSVAYFWSSKLKSRLDEKLASSKFDVIFVFCAFMAQYVLDQRGAYRVLDYVDIDSAKWSEYSRYKAFPLSLGYAFEATKLRNYERRVGQNFNRCSVVSEGEREEFNSLEIATRCSVLPNGVDTDYFLPTGTGGRESSVIVFLGRMDYFPNVEGITFFVREILPKISEKCPGVKLRIVGSNPTKAVRGLAKISSVSITGYVSDVREFLRDAAVSVVPLRIARGTQNKILESMAMGIPVVATSQAARGIGATIGEHFLVADEAEDFAKQVIAILENDELRLRLSEAGRRQVEKKYVWSTALRSLDDILSEA